MRACAAPTGLRSFSTLPSTPPAAACWAKLFRPSTPASAKSALPGDPGCEAGFLALHSTAANKTQFSDGLHNLEMRSGRVAREDSLKDRLEVVPIDSVGPSCLL